MTNMLSELRVPLTILGLIVLLGAPVLQANSLATAALAAGAKAEAAFDQAHPYNAALHERYVEYRQAADKAERLHRPAPVWGPTACELQTLDLRDYTRDVAITSLQVPWPTSMWLIPHPPEPVAALTPDCKLERAAFVTKDV